VPLGGWAHRQTHCRANDIFEQYVSYLRQTHSLVEKTYQLEKAGAFTGTGTPEGKSLADEQLAAAATELRDLIYTAWIKICRFCSATPLECGFQTGTACSGKIAIS
jgi:hypothetical protein